MFLRGTNASRESVRRWFHRFSKLFSVGRRFRYYVAVDETVVKMHGLRAYVWSAVDVDSGEILAIYASWNRNMLIALKFLRMVLGRCINKPLIIVDIGPWYRWALERLGLKYRYQRLGLRNAVERFFGHLKQRTRRDKEVLQQHLEDPVNRRLCNSNSNNQKHTHSNKNPRRRITCLTGSSFTAWDGLMRAV
jgi:transposase-like protein